MPTIEGITHQNPNHGSLALRSEEPSDQTFDQDSVGLTAAARVLAFTPASLESYSAQWELFAACLADRNDPAVADFLRGLGLLEAQNVSAPLGVEPA